MGVFRQAHRYGVEAKLLETLRLRGWLWSLQRDLTRDATSKAFQAWRVPLTASSRWRGTSLFMGLLLSLDLR
jgi:hypothetical protein